MQCPHCKLPLQEKQRSVQAGFLGRYFLLEALAMVFVAVFIWQGMFGLLALFLVLLGLAFLARGGHFVRCQSCGHAWFVWSRKHGD